MLQATALFPRYFLRQSALFLTFQARFLTRIVTGERLTDAWPSTIALFERSIGSVPVVLAFASLESAHVQFSGLMLH